MTTYTLTKTDRTALMEMLDYGQGFAAMELVKSLKPNSQEPAWYCNPSGYGSYRFYKPSETTPKDAQPLYTHPAPMSKEDMVKVLEALQKTNEEWKSLADSGDAGFWVAEEQPHYQATAEAITIMQSAIEATK